MLVTQDRIKVRSTKHDEESSQAVRDSEGRKYSSQNPPTKEQLHRLTTTCVNKEYLERIQLQGKI